MFGKKKDRERLVEALIAAGRPCPHQITYVDAAEPRPCYAKGRKAIFHRWTNTANPVLPHGVEPDDERARYFQYRATKGIVEYEDGTVERVWPQDIRFADGGQFGELIWLPCDILEER